MVNAVVEASVTGSANAGATTPRISEGRGSIVGLPSVAILPQLLRRQGSRAYPLTGTASFDADVGAATPTAATTQLQFAPSSLTASAASGSVGAGAAMGEADMINTPLPDATVVDPPASAAAQQLQAARARLQSTITAREGFFAPPAGNAMESEGVATVAMAAGSKVPTAQRAGPPVMFRVPSARSQSGSVTSASSVTAGAPSAAPALAPALAASAAALPTALAQASAINAIGASIVTKPLARKRRAATTASGIAPGLSMGLGVGLGLDTSAMTAETESADEFAGAAPSSVASGPAGGIPPVPTTGLSKSGLPLSVPFNHGITRTASARSAASRPPPGPSAPTSLGAAAACAASAAAGGPGSGSMLGGPVPSTRLSASTSGTFVRRLSVTTADDETAAGPAADASADSVMGLSLRVPGASTSADDSVIRAAPRQQQLRVAVPLDSPAAIQPLSTSAARAAAALSAAASGAPGFVPAGLQNVLEDEELGDVDGKGAGEGFVTVPIRPLSRAAAMSNGSSNGSTPKIAPEPLSTPVNGPLGAMGARTNVARPLPRGAAGEGTGPGLAGGAGGVTRGRSQSYADAQAAAPGFAPFASMATAAGAQPYGSFNASQHMLSSTPSSPAESSNALSDMVYIYDASLFSPASLPANARVLTANSAAANAAIASASRLAGERETVASVTNFPSSSAGEMAVAANFADGRSPTFASVGMAGRNFASWGRISPLVEQMPPPATGAAGQCGPASATALSAFSFSTAALTGAGATSTLTSGFSRAGSRAAAVNPQPPAVLSSATATGPLAAAAGAATAAGAAAGAPGVGVKLNGPTQAGGRITGAVLSRLGLGGAGFTRPTAATTATTSATTIAANASDTADMGSCVPAASPLATARVSDFGPKAPSKASGAIAATGAAAGRTLSTPAPHKVLQVLTDLQRGDPQASSTSAAGSVARGSALMQSPPATVTSPTHALANTLTRTLSLATAGIPSGISAFNMVQAFAAGAAEGAATSTGAATLLEGADGSQQTESDASTERFCSSNSQEVDLAAMAAAGVMAVEVCDSIDSDAPLSMTHSFCPLGSESGVLAQRKKKLREPGGRAIYTGVQTPASSFSGIGLPSAFSAVRDELSAAQGSPPYPADDIAAAAGAAVGAAVGAAAGAAAGVAPPVSSAMEDGDEENAPVAAAALSKAQDPSAGRKRTFFSRGSVSGAPQ